MTFKDAAIIFDLDGTLVDTAPDLLAALNHTLEDYGAPKISMDDLSKLVGDGAKAMIATGLHIADKSVSPVEEDKLLQKFLTYYQENIAVLSKPFDNLRPCLTYLQQNGAKLGVCTNKREHLSKKLLNELELSHFFEAIIGADTLPMRKPDPGHILGTIEHIQGDTKRAVMIGDSKNDFKAAQAAGIPVVAVTFGYTAIPVVEFSPDAIIHHYDELLPVLERLL